VTISYSKNSGATFAIGVTTVTVTATDGAGVSDGPFVVPVGIGPGAQAATKPAARSRPAQARTSGRRTRGPGR